ncbi:MAG: hypothetical protein GX605_01065 [Chloroflexi bacterium]|nr:hypothetical protein [Chloroflexota bacterium]
MRRLISGLLGLAAVAALLGAAASCQAPAREDVLVYSGPVEVGVAAGEIIPGTDLRYVRRTDQGAEVLIGGQKAIRRTGDSLEHEGRPAEGVRMKLALRVALFDEKTLHSVGAVELQVRRPAPQALPIATESPLWHAVPVSYWVNKGKAIPGTTITYVGRTDQGADLGGVEGYPYRKGADSILWEGKLRENVWLKLDLRTGVYDEERLQVVGLATVWVEE